MATVNINIDLYNKQKEILKAFLDNETEYITCKIGRRAGKSFLGMYLLVRACLSHNRIKACFVGPTYTICEEMFNLVTESLKESGLIVHQVNTSPQRIRFVNGSILTFYSAQNPDNLRGKKFMIGVIDEAAFIKDYSLSSVILPCFANKVKGLCRKIVFLSTPMMKKGVFYDYYSMGVKDGTKFKSFSAPSSISPYVDADYLDTQRQIMREADFKREYLAEFIDSADSLFKYGNSSIDSLTPYSKCYYGLDIGKSDKTSISIISDKYELVYNEEFSGTDYTIILDKVQKIIKEYRCVDGYVEVNGPGSPFYDFLKKHVKCTEWFTSNKSKNVLIEDLALSLEKGELKILNTYYDMITMQLDSVTQEFNTSTRTVKYVFGRDSTGHCDSVVSLGLALQYVKYRQSKGVYAFA